MCSLGAMHATWDAALADLDARLAGQSHLVMAGLAGPPGAGKSTVARQVARILGHRGAPACVVPQDGFHLSHRQLDRQGLLGAKGTPPTFDVAGFVNLLRRIRALGPRDVVYVPEYDRHLHEPVAARGRVDAATRVVLVEGNYLLLDAGPWDQVRDLLDVTWYLDAPPAFRDERLLHRHTSGGRTADDARTWIDTVDHANTVLIETTRDRADFVLDTTGHIPSFRGEAFPASRA